MGVLRNGLGLLIGLIYFYISVKIVLPIMVSAAPPPVSLQKPANDRMVKPPRFPYDGPFGFYSSGLLCKFDGTTYIGGWFGRSCAGPIAPFMQPTPPSTPPTTPATTEAPSTSQAPTQAPYQYYTPEQLSWFQTLMNYNTGYRNPQQYQDDYGDPIEGNPWDPDDDSVFIENYGRSASKPGFKLGDPHQGK